MGIYIKITKHKEDNGTGYYEVLTNDFGGAHFYIAINRLNKKIYVYESEDPKSLIGEIDCAQEDKPLNSFSNIPMAIMGRVIMRGIKAFNMDEFPQYLSYEA